MLKDVASLIKAKSIDGSTLTTDFQAINAQGLPFPCYEVRIVNASTKDVAISIDGTSLYEYVSAGDTRYLFAQQASSVNNNRANWPRGMIFWAAVTATAGSGDIYILGSYQPVNQN